MKVVIRTDASHQIGTGHLMRCLTLADVLRGNGDVVSFICREHAGNLCDLVEEKGYAVHRLPYAEPEVGIGSNEYLPWLAVSQDEDARQTATALQQEREKPTWLIVDHYALYEKWEKAMRPHTERIMVIDDLANRHHNCDLLLDQNLYEDLHTRYDSLLPPGCQKLLGPTYALLRPEFLQARQSLRKRDGIVKRLLIFFGGVDPTNETAKALEAVQMMARSNIAVDVVAGSSNPNRAQVEAVSQDMRNVTVHHQVENMAELMIQADLAIGGGGTTTWERCYLGLPTITIVVADNQREMIETIADRGAVWNMGWNVDVLADDLKACLESALNNPEAVRAMGRAARQIMDGRYGHKENPVTAALLAMTSVAC